MLEPTRFPLVLLVEDSEDDAFFFRWALHKTGLRCDLVRVADGGAARAHLEEARVGARRRPDLVFLDLKLPTYSGFEILASIRMQAWPCPLPVIVLSGSEHDRDIARATGLGARDYFVKPVSEEQLHGAFATLQPSRASVASAS